MKTYVLMAAVDDEQKILAPLFLITNPPHPPIYCGFGRVLDIQTRELAPATEAMRLALKRLKSPDELLFAEVYPLGTPADRVLEDVQGLISRSRYPHAIDANLYQPLYYLFLAVRDDYERLFDMHQLKVLPEVSGTILLPNSIAFDPLGEPTHFDPISDETKAEVRNLIARKQK